MRSDAALDVLRSLRPASPEIESEAGFKQDAAFLRMASRSEPGRWAVVYTPGDRWFSLEVPGGFSLDHFEEDTSDDEVRGLLTRYANLAVRYLEDGATIRKSPLLRVPCLSVRTNQGSVVLRRSVAGQLKRMVTLGRRP